MTQFFYIAITQLRIMVIIIGNGTGDLSSNEVVFDSLNINVLQKGMNPSLSSPG